MKGMPLVIAHTVTPQTLPRLSQMARLAYSLGASTLMIGQVLPSGRANKYSEEILLSIDENKFEKIVFIVLIIVSVTEDCVYSKGPPLSN